MTLPLGLQLLKSAHEFVDLAISLDGSLYVFVA